VACQGGQADDGRVSVEAPAELLEGGREPSRWKARWAALPGARRRLLALLGALVLLGAAFVWFLDWSAERESAQRIALTASLGVWSSSSTPPGGEVGYFVVVRNEGARRVSVTSVDATTARLRLRMRDDADRRLDPGAETAIPLSVRLTCGTDGGTDNGTDGLPAEITLRREGGGPAVRRVQLRPASTLLDVAVTVCGVRPDLRDRELSGPVLGPPPAEGGNSP
jgi:hypothetical protein